MCVYIITHTYINTYIKYKYFTVAIDSGRSLNRRKHNVCVCIHVNLCKHMIFLQLL